MTAGNAMESKTCKASILAVQFYTGSPFSACNDLHRKPVGELCKLFHLGFQLFGDRTIIGLHTEDQIIFHAGEHTVQLCHRIGIKEVAAYSACLPCRLCLWLFSLSLLGTQAGFLLHGGSVFFQFGCSQRTVTHSGDHLTESLNAHVTGGIQAVHRGFHAAIGENIPLLVQIGDALYQSGGRCVTCKDKHADVVALGITVFGDLTGLVVAIADCTEDAVPQHLLYLGVGMDGDFGMISGVVCHTLGAGKILFTDQNMHMAGIFGEEYRLFGCRIAAAYHKNFLAGEKLAVTGGAIGNAPATEVGLSFEAHHPGAGTGSQQHAKGLQVAPGGFDRLHITGKFQTFHLC